MIEFGLITNYATAQLFQTEINSSSVYYINPLNATKVRGKQVGPKIRKR